MSLVDQISREVLKLPREAQQEVLDYVNFLVQKYTPKPDDENEAWSQAEQAARNAPPAG